VDLEGDETLDIGVYDHREAVGRAEALEHRPRLLALDAELLNVSLENRGDLPGILAVELLVACGEGQKNPE
jgi:hypothetical protein